MLRTSLAGALALALPVLLSQVLLALSHAGEALAPSFAACVADAGDAVELSGGRAVGPAACRRSNGEGHGSRDAALLQTRRATVRLAIISETPALQSGDLVFLRAQRSGKRITVQKNGTVHAKWFNTGTWEQFAIERVAGPGVVQSGDEVFLRGHWGMPLTAQGSAVHAQWNHTGSWQKWVIQSMGGGSIASGSKVFIMAHTGARMDVDAPDSVGVVQARWNHMGSWQAVVVEEKFGKVSSQAWEHLQFLNALRAQGHTCPGGVVFQPNPTPLRLDCRLWKAALLHSQDMREQRYFSHTSLAGRSPWQRAAEHGTSANAENIAAGYGSALDTLNQFKNSDPHCLVMMNSQRTVAGIGYATGGEWNHYWTQMFAGWSGTVQTWCYPA